MTLTVATSIDDALAALAAGARPIAGGTDLVVGARQGKAPLPQDLVAIDRITELATLAESAGTIRIGAGVTHAELLTDPIVLERLTGIADAAALIGSPATRNVGTIGGNVMNGSPAMDTGAPLLALGARVELRTATGSREVALNELWTGPGRTSAADDELCTALVVPTPAPASGSAYIRLEYRRAMEIAVVGAAAAVTIDADQSLTSVALALTAVAPTIIEVTGLDGFLGTPITEDSLDAIADAAREQAQPISDLRASDRYRRHTIGVMARRAVHAASVRAGGQSIPVPVNRAFGVGENPENIR